MRTFYNYRTRTSESFADEALPPVMRDYVPQVPEALAYYELLMAEGSAPLLAAQQVLALYARGAFEEDSPEAQMQAALRVIYNKVRRQQQRLANTQAMPDGSDWRDLVETIDRECEWRALIPWLEQEQADD